MTRIVKATRLAVEAKAKAKQENQQGSPLPKNPFNKDKPFTDSTGVTAVFFSRLRVSRVSDNLYSKWKVDYLPIGKSEWCWNWKTDREFASEKDAREYANELFSYGYVEVHEYSSPNIGLLD